MGVCSRLYVVVPNQYSDVVSRGGVCRAEGEVFRRVGLFLFVPNNSRERRDAAPARLALLRQMVGIRVAFEMDNTGDIEAGTE